MDSYDLVVAGTCRDAGEAEIKKNALNEMDIYCAIENESQAGFTGTFDIKLLVPKELEEKAKQYLSEHESSADS